MGKKRNRIARLVCVWKISSSHRLRLEDVVVASTLLGCKRLARERERERRYTTTTTLYGAIGNPLPLPASFIFQPNSSSSLPLSLGKLERNPSRSSELCAMAANTQHTSNRIFNSREELPLFCGWRAAAPRWGGGLPCSGFEADNIPRSSRAAKAEAHLSTPATDQYFPVPGHAGNE
jgi:hypothetical protein